MPLRCTQTLWFNNNFVFGVEQEETSHTVSRHLQFGNRIGFRNSLVVAHDVHEYEDF